MARDAAIHRQWLRGFGLVGRRSSLAPGTPFMHLPRVTVGPAHDHDDAWLLETIAISMARVDPRSLSGAPVLVAELRPHLVRHFPGTADLVAALLRLERSDRLTLIRRDPAFPAADVDQVTCIRDESVDLIGVALR